jgi:hypothetical protein
MLSHDKVEIRLRMGFSQVLTQHRSYFCVLFECFILIETL